jgi:hypothetical protein
MQSFDATHETELRLALITCGGAEALAGPASTWGAASAGRVSVRSKRWSLFPVTAILRS